MRIALQSGSVTVEIEGEFEMRPGMKRALAAFAEVAATAVPEKKGSAMGFQIERAFQDPIQMDAGKPSSGGVYGG